MLWYENTYITYFRL